MIIGTPEALELIDRKSILDFFFRLKKDNGSFAVNIGGECDVRGTYTVISTAALLGLLTPELTDGVAEWVASCQTYEGGIAGEPGDEAHGGYSFCGLATLIILEKQNSIALEKLLDWAVKRQMTVEGGFQGRTNKLVDGCYSFWVGAIPILIQSTLKPEDKTKNGCFDGDAAAKYILGACQCTINGGFRDKPGIMCDLNHTCYCLSGLCASARNMDNKALFGNLGIAEIDFVHNINKGKISPFWE
ncbi:hypothetical protein MHBO_001043 [Bonamia ostreae]|uniref:Prenyltransferase alpha-alpha toroid domain-containing protein n=1 Tax=Bonamia ostreae TaxID=126728 RepID=A0ABV2AHN6_9EUKA